MENVKFVNLTPHPIVIRLADGTDNTIAPSGKIARVDFSSFAVWEVATEFTMNGGKLKNLDESPSNVIGEIGGVPVLPRSTFTEVVGLPDPEENTAYIVSDLVAGVVRRKDVFSPATGPKDSAIRNERGHIVAVKFLKATM